MSGRYALLVVGGGPAGFAAARAYRESDGAGAVAIVADEGRMPYRRPPLTKELLRGETAEAELPLEEEIWLAEHEIALVTGRAVALETGPGAVSLSGGRKLAYRTCVLATGAEPTRLPVPGADDPAVRVLRSVTDLRELNARLAPEMSVAVIGSGFIGCEAAASLRRRGHPVTLVSDEPAPNAGRLGDDAAGRIAGWLEEDGIVLRLGRAVEAIARDGERLMVSADGVTAPADLVLMAVGVAPRIELAAAAEAEIDEGAVAVDAAMRTSVPGVLAAGDVCRAENATAGRRLRVEHWGEALAHGEVAGQTAAGRTAVWGDVPGFWSTIGTRQLKYAAWGDGFDDARFVANGDRFTVRFTREGTLVGILTHGDDDAYERGREAIAREAG